jgi:branched-chain amino acid transport system substrate-binding protein
MLAAALGGPARADILIGMAGPMTGPSAWFGEQMERGAAQAVADLNAAGGVLGQQVQLITADDFCDPEQAVAAARKLVGDGVIFVVGHFCSGASIAASEIYAASGVLQISPSSSNPTLTELGRANVFRVTYRDDATGIAAGNYLADHWPDKKIAILHDNSAFGKGSAELTKAQLNRRGATEAIYESYLPGKVTYGPEIDALQAADVAALFIGGYHTEIALMARAARDRGYPVQLVTAMSLQSEDFGLIAGAAAEGALFLDVADPRGRAEAAPVVERFRASGYEPEGYTLYAYAAVQVWAQAAEKAGSLGLEPMIASLREHQFDTVLGPIDFDDKGDLTVQNPVWYVWRNGTYAPLEQDSAKE